MQTRRAAALAVALVAALALVVTACSGGPDSSQQTASSTSPTSTPSSTSSSSTSSSSTTTTTTSSSSTRRSRTSTSTSPTTTHRSPSKTKPTSKHKHKHQPKPRPKDPLTGLSLSKNPVIAVKIDNTSAGFPQFGITQADIIYTEQVEGGLTRLIAIFHSKLPKEVGAVRSIRSTDFQLLPSYGKPILVASGGAPRWVRALRNSALVGVLNDAGAAGLWRSQFGDATHNVHANLQTIAKVHRGQGKAQRMGFTFRAKAPRLAKARKVSTIDVTMLAGRYQFTYSHGRYLAHHSGTPYVDQNGYKVHVANVLVQHVRDEPDGQLDPDGSPSYLSHTIGQGDFTLYRNGRAIDGTWHRSSLSDPTRFVDSKGHTVTFQPGKTWVLLAPQTSHVNRG